MSPAGDAGQHPPRSQKRPAAPPPQLPGFTYVEVLGSGGFADVYLYEQQLPRRRVAVKVLLPERMPNATAEQFTAEANVMAMLSTHPAIVTIHQAGVADDGRPYLVMEYCPRPNLHVRSRAAAFSVAEALRVGIQVAAAVETAHRAGILHRDIKPANILVTEYNRPALTDFGIATTADADPGAAGLSIPWSPPEAFRDVPESGVRSDVWALGATVFTLLAGRSPFEVPGGRNGGAVLIERIETQPVPWLERADVPESLQLALERAMAKRSADRYDTAVAFARALQRVQIELAHSVTPIDILDDAPLDASDDDEDDELTRVRGIVSIEPQTAPAAGSTRKRPEDVGADAAAFAPGTAAAGASPADTGPDDRTVIRATPTSAAPSDPAALEADVEATLLRPAPSPAPTAPPAAAPPAAAPPADAAPAATGARESPASAAGRSRRPLWIGLIVGAAVLIVVGVVAALSAVVGAPEPSPSATEAAPADPLDGYVPPVAELAGTQRGDEVVFTWTNPDPAEGDTFAWYTYTLQADGVPQRTDETQVRVPVDASGTTCIAVQLIRDNGRGGDEVRGCTP